MEMEVMIPSPPVDFNFDSACTSPYVSVPSSPQQFGNVFFSAPTSPTRSASFFREFNTFSGGDTTASASGSSLPSTIPFSWEEKPGTPKSKDRTDENEFEFDFSGQLQRTSLSADELFDGGKIKPLKPPPRLQFTELRHSDSPKSPKSPRSPIRAKIFREALSPRRDKIDFDPFEAAIEQTRRENYNPEQRGRERTHSSSNSNRRQKEARSLSPFKVSDILVERESNQQSSNSSKSSKTKQSSSLSSSFSASAWLGYKKWKLRDFLLFRSVSEGRASTEEAKSSSFRSTESTGSVSRRRGRVSAHEMHYTANRAVSEDMKRKTFLPYNQGLLGCLGFNPAVNEISRGLGSMTRG